MGRRHITEGNTSGAQIPVENLDRSARILPDS